MKEKRSIKTKNSKVSKKCLYIRLIYIKKENGRSNVFSSYIDETRNKKREVDRTFRKV